MSTHGHSVGAFGSILRRPAELPVVETPYLNFWEAVSYCRLEDNKRPEEIIYRAIRAGVLKPAGKMGGKLLFTRDSLDAWIRGKNARAQQ